MLEVATSCNYKRVITTCTHFVTAQIALELGYKPKYSVQYESFEFEGRRIFSNVPAPHKEAVLFEKVIENTITPFSYTEKNNG